MLDGALHSLSDGRRRRGPRDHRHRARAAAGDDPGAPRPVVRARAGRAPRSRVRAGAARACRPGCGSHEIAFDVDIARRGDRATAGSRSTRSCASCVDQAIRRGTDHVRIDVVAHVRRRLVATVADDAEPERRRRSLEAIEERVSQLHGTLEVRRCRRRHRDPRRPPGAHRSQVVTIASMADENGHRDEATSCFSGRRPATGCRSATASRPPVGAELDEDGHGLVVTKVGPSPLPGDSRPCAYTAPGPGRLNRSAGVLLHPTSLPGGRLGTEAERFVDWLAAAGQRWWQILPLVPPEPARVAVHLAVGVRVLERPPRRPARGGRRRPRSRASGSATPTGRRPGSASPGAGSLADQVRFEREWSGAARATRRRAACGSSATCRSTSRTAAPTSSTARRSSTSSEQAGAPPDSFNQDGQLWGNPLYRWPAHRAEGYRWWTERFRRAFELVDVTRVDHFRGFVAGWAVPKGRDERRGRPLAEGPRRGALPGGRAGARDAPDRRRGPRGDHAARPPAARRARLPGDARAPVRLRRAAPRTTTRPRTTRSTASSTREPTTTTRWPAGGNTRRTSSAAAPPPRGARPGSTSPSPPGLCSGSPTRPGPSSRSSSCRTCSVSAARRGSTPRAPWRATGAGASSPAG